MMKKGFTIHISMQCVLKVLFNVYVKAIV